MADLDDVIPGWSTGDWQVPEWSFDSTPALVVNHMQMGIVGTGQYSGAPIAQERKQMERLGTIKQQKKLIDAFRERNLPVIFMSVVPNPIGYVPKWGFIFQMVNNVVAAGRTDNPELAKAVQVIDEMGRLPHEPLLLHTGHSPMTGSHLEEYVRQFGTREIVMTGWTAHSTLYNSMVQLTDKWFSVVVPADATGAPDRDLEAADIVLKKMMRMWGLVTSVDDVIEHLPAKPYGLGATDVPPIG
jgi:nicotinamidase-related amidase